MNKILYSKQSVLLAAIVVTTLHCTSEVQNSTAPPLLREEVVVQLNGTPISRNALNEYLSLGKGYAEDNLTENALARQFQEFIVQMILLQNALGESPLGNFLQHTKSSSTNPAERSVLSSKWGKVFLEIQNYLRAELDVASEIRLSDLFSYYSEHHNEFQVGDRRRVLEILVATRSQAETIRSQLESGDFRKFRAMAARHSIGQHENGELGIIEKGQLPIAFEELLFSLSTGEISSIFTSQLGHHIFCVEEHIPRHFQKFYEVQALIFNRLLAAEERKALSQFVESRIADTNIQIFDSKLETFWRERDANLG